MAGRMVALIRGINVGHAKRVVMADLRALVEGLGYGEVQTLLNSGNVVFSAPRAAPAAAAARIEKAMAERIGVSARVIVLTAAELAAAVAGNPLLPKADNPSRLLAAVYADPNGGALLKPLAKRDWSPEALAVGKRVAYLWCPDGLMASPLAQAVGDALGDAVTMRNWTTLTKLLDLAQDRDGPRAKGARSGKG